MIEAILLAANIYNVNPSLLLAVCSVESDLRPGAINHDDGGRASYGICQVQLRTARFIHGPTHVSDLLNPERNALIAAKYFRYQLDRYDGDSDCAVAAYNAGSCKKNQTGLYINQKYVEKVKRRYKKYRRIYGDDQRPIYIRDRSLGTTVLPRGPEGDQATDDVQGSSTLARDERASAPVQGGNDR